MATKLEELERLHEQAQFVFRGRVVKAGASNVRNIAGNRHTAIVAVDEVLRGTDVMRALAGTEVTVVFDAAHTADPPGSRLFFTNGLVYGATVAVRAVGHSAATDHEVSAVHALNAAAATRPLELRVASADAIVTGRVLALSSAEKLPRPKSEHDPDWWIAQVLVLVHHHGAPLDGEIEVLFANSDDIAWRTAPKLHAGESAIMLLHTLDAASAPKSVKRAIYQVIDAHDVLAVDRIEELKRAIEKGKGG